jgi:uncharacterized protein YeeX (DUF496 family)
LSRRIPERTKRDALRLWLEGCTFRSICSKQGVSLGAMHDIVEEARRRAPDIEDLRQLNIALRESGVALIDVVRGCPILRRLDELGVGVDQLSKYVEFSEKIVSEKGAGSEAFVDSALRLLDLEQDTGKTHREILAEYEERRSEIQRLDGERASLANEVHGLEGAKAGLEGELAALRRERGETVGSWERLKRLDLKRLDRLAEFVEDYEKLNFSAEEVKRLSGWEVSLALMGIKSEELDDYIKRHGPLSKQLRELGEEVAGEKRRLEHVTRQYRSLSTQVAIASALNGLLTSRMISIACPRCGRPVPRRIPTFWELDNAVGRGLAYQVGCLNCGLVNQVAPRDIFANVGWAILQAEAGAQLQPPLKSR